MIERHSRITFLRALRMIALAAGLAAMASCGGGVGGFSGSVGDTPPTTPQVSFNVLGTVGTPFSLVITDTQESWNVVGTVPLNIAIENDNPPVRMIATKTSNDPNLLSLEIVVGFTVQSLSSTTAPFGTVSVATNGSTNDVIAPSANPDLRIFVESPLGERFQGLVEDSTTGFQISTRAPALFLFENPNGPVVGDFIQLQNLGPFDAIMTLDGTEVASVVGGPTVIIKEP